MKAVFLATAIASAFALLPPRTNEPGKQLVVISAPSMWDQRYRERFQDLVAFDLDLIRNLMSRDNVLVLADKHTMRYFRGKLPDDVLLEADIFDIWMRQFAPMVTKDKELTTFVHGGPDVDPAFAKQLDLSVKKFARDHYLHFDQTSDLIISGNDVVTNGHGLAILSNEVLEKNMDKYQDWAIRIQIFNNFGKSIFLEPFTNTTFSEEGPLPLENLMSFIAPDLLALTEMNVVDMERIETLIAKKFRGAVHVLPLKTHYMSESYKSLKSVCGLHTSLLVTDDYIYMPVFGNDPANWEIGHSAMLDKIAYRKVQVNTPKHVVAINVPHRICQMGGSPRSLTWQLSGPTADRLVNLARMRANIRRVKLKSVKTKAVKAAEDFKQVKVKAV